MEKSISLTLKIIGILLGVLVLYFIRNLIGYVLLAFVLSSALRPGVDWLQKKKIPRFLGGIIVFILLFTFFGLILYFTFPPFVNEIQSFVSTLPQYWQNFLLWLPRFEMWLETSPFGGNIREAINQYIQKLSQGVAGLIGFVSGVFGKILNLILIIVLIFYFSVEEKISEKFYPFLIMKEKTRQEEVKKRISKYWKIAQDQAGRWLQGYILLGFIVGIMVYIGLSILGIRYSLILAVLAGILEIIPWLGPVAAGLMGTLIALLQGGWSIALWTTFVFFIVQQIENYLIIPVVMKSRIDLDPLLTLIILFVGAKLGGTLGMVLAVPMGAILLAFLKEKNRTGE